MQADNETDPPGPSSGDEAAVYASSNKPPIETEDSDTFSVLLTGARDAGLSPLWPIGLCIAWIMARDLEAAARRYALHRMWTEARFDDGWYDARQKLIHALLRGDLAAHALEGGELRAPRVQIPRTEWTELRLTQRGLFDEIRRPDGTVAYRDVQVAPDQAYRQWRKTSFAQITVAEKSARKVACLKRLEELMRESPNDPVPKRIMRLHFPGMPKDPFDLLFAQASANTGAVAWSTAGPRRRKSL